MDKIKASGIGDEIIELWNEGWSADRIAGFTGDIVVGRSILKFLNRSGIATHDSRRIVECGNCGIEFKKVRNVFRRSIRHYCCRECYWEKLKNPNYIRTNMGSRRARAAVRGCGYLLLPDEVVHHIDEDAGNNDPGNLMVFANQGDHTRWHRLGGEKSGVVPVWPKKQPEPFEKVKKQKPKKVIKTVEDIPVEYRDPYFKPMPKQGKKVKKIIKPGADIEIEKIKQAVQRVRRRRGKK